MAFSTTSRHPLISIVLYLALLFTQSALVVSQELVTCETTAGDFTITMNRDWAPFGYDRFMDLVAADFFTDQLLYRKIEGFLVQFGVASHPNVTREWSMKKIEDDPQKKIPFTQGTVSFAGNGPRSRSSHIFISLEPDGKKLGSAEHERPFGRIEDAEGQKVVESFYDGYGDLTGLQGKLIALGNKVAAERFPKLDKIKRCFLVKSNHGEL